MGNNWCDFAMHTRNHDSRAGTKVADELALYVESFVHGTREGIG